MEVPLYIVNSRISNIDSYFKEHNLDLCPVCMFI